MKKLFLTATLSAVLIGFTGGAFAQSNAMEESNDANSEALSQGSGVTTSDQQEKSAGQQEEGVGQQGKASGHSDAANQSINAIESETDGTTSIENSEELDELSADGQSDAAGDSLESQ